MCIAHLKLFIFVPEGYRVFRAFQQQPDQGLWCPYYARYFVTLSFALEYPTKTGKKTPSPNTLGTFFFYGWKEIMLHMQDVFIDILVT